MKSAEDIVRDEEFMVMTLCGDTELCYENAKKEWIEIVRNIQRDAIEECVVKCAERSQELVIRANKMPACVTQDIIIAESNMVGAIADELRALKEV